jgi:DNA-directed RNA polymerase specialized sigma24 family protein
VLVLRHQEGLSRAQIASVLDVSEAAVKGRLVRGSEYLRHELRRLTGFGE